MRRERPRTSPLQMRSVRNLPQTAFLSSKRKKAYAGDANDFWRELQSDLWKTFVKPPRTPDSLQAKQNAAKIKFENVAQSPHQNCYSERRGISESARSGQLLHFRRLAPHSEMLKSRFRGTDCSDS